MSAIYTSAVAHIQKELPRLKSITETISNQQFMLDMMVLAEKVQSQPQVTREDIYAVAFALAKAELKHLQSLKGRDIQPTIIGVDPKLNPPDETTDATPLPDAALKQVMDTNPTAPHTQFVRLWVAEFERVHKRKYVFMGGRDAKAVANLLNSTKLTPAELASHAALALVHINLFYCKRSITIHSFWECYNGIMAELDVFRKKLRERPDSVDVPSL